MGIWLPGVIEVGALSERGAPFRASEALVSRGILLLLLLCLGGRTIGFIR